MKTRDKFWYGVACVVMGIYTLYAFVDAARGSWGWMLFDLVMFFIADTWRLNIKEKYNVR